MSILVEKKKIIQNNEDLLDIYKKSMIDFIEKLAQSDVLTEEKLQIAHEILKITFENNIIKTRNVNKSGSNIEGIVNENPDITMEEFNSISNLLQKRGLVFQVYFIL